MLIYPMIKALIRKIYSFIPFKKQVYQILRYLWLPKESVYKHLHFKGIINITVNDHSTFKMKNYGYSEETQLFWVGLAGCWERQSMKIWIELCKSSQVIFDVGANTGVYALMAAALNKQASIYAFEPVARVFEKLEENIALNGYSINCVKKAASNFTGKAVIYDVAAEHVYSVTVNKNCLDDGVMAIPTEIETVTLAEVIRNEKLPGVHLLKIDVETHEGEVLEGLQEYLSINLPTLIIEILNEEVAARIERILNGLPYLFFNIDENNAIRKVEKLTRSDYYNFLICTQPIADNLKRKGIITF